MYVEGLWRYPVKSLGAEPLEQAHLTSDGVEGDRVVHVQGRGGPLTGRTRHDLLTLPGGTAGDGTPTVAGHPWHSPAALSEVRRVTGTDTHLVPYAGPERFDITNVLVATDGAVRSWGHDVSRLRPTILVGGVEGLGETAWPGRALAIGDVLVGLLSRRVRCIVTAVDPLTGALDLDAYRRLRRTFGNQMGLNAWVIRPGTVNVGDEVSLVGSDELPLDVGGWVVGAPYRVRRDRDDTMEPR